MAIPETTTEICTICLEEIDRNQNASRKSTKNKVTETACGHLFHSKCLNKWARIKPTCPLCWGEIDAPPPPPAKPLSKSFVKAAKVSAVVAGAPLVVGAVIAGSVPAATGAVVGAGLGTVYGLKKHSAGSLEVPVQVASSKILGCGVLGGVLGGVAAGVPPAAVGATLASPVTFAISPVALVAGGVVLLMDQMG